VINDPDPAFDAPPTRCGTIRSERRCDARLNPMGRTIFLRHRDVCGAPTLFAQGRTCYSHTS